MRNQQQHAPRFAKIIVFWVAIIFASWSAVVIGGIFALTPQACNQKVQSEDEAKKALGVFFSSDNSATLKLISYLRQDGLEDGHLDKLKSGCASCYVYRGDKYSQDPDSWYVVTSIAPPERKKAVVLEIECEKAVWLDATMHGG